MLEKVLLPMFRAFLPLTLMKRQIKRNTEKQDAFKIIIMDRDGRLRTVFFEFAGKIGVPDLNGEQQNCENYSLVAIWNSPK